MKNIKILNNRNPSISNNFNNIAHTLENKSINFDISKSINYSKELSEINNDNLSKISVLQQIQIQFHNLIQLNLKIFLDLK